MLLHWVWYIGIQGFIAERVPTVNNLKEVAVHTPRHNHQQLRFHVYYCLINAEPNIDHIELAL